MKKLALLLIIISLPLLQNCTSIVNSTTSEPITTDPSKRTFGSYVDDKRLQVIIGVNIRKADSQFEKARIDVTSYNGIILLTGQVPNQNLKQLATQTASAVTNVRQVHNELAIRENSSFIDRTSDGWLATKVKAVLLGDAETKGMNAKTIVEAGTVYLMGLVTLEDSDKAANLVSNVNGVKEVVKVFEYIEK